MPFMSSKHWGGSHALPLLTHHHTEWAVLSARGARLSLRLRLWLAQSPAPQLSDRWNRLSVLSPMTVTRTPRGPLFTQTPLCNLCHSHEITRLGETGRTRSQPWQIHMCCHLKDTPATCLCLALSGWRAGSQRESPFPLLNYSAIRRCVSCPQVPRHLWLPLLGPRSFRDGTESRLVGRCPAKRCQEVCGKKCREMKSEVMRNVRENWRRCVHSEGDLCPAGLKPSWRDFSKRPAEDVTPRPSGTLPKLNSKRSGSYRQLGHHVTYCGDKKRGIRKGGDANLCHREDS